MNSISRSNLEANSHGGNCVNSQGATVTEVNCGLSGVCSLELCSLSCSSSSRVRRQKGRTRAGGRAALDST